MRPTESTRQAHDGYWRLSKKRQDLTAKDIRSHLASRHYYTPHKMKKADLEDNLYRANRGLMSYYNITNDRLRGFLKDRKIDLQQTIIGNRLGTARELIQVLQDADENLKFEKFTELPPELRNMVYEYYFASFDQPIYAPTQPPLTLTCRLLRKESLPIFYSSSEFLLTFSKTNPLEGEHLRMPNQLALFIHNTSLANFATIQHIHVKVGWASVDRGGTAAARERGPGRARDDEYVPEEFASLKLSITIQASEQKYQVRYEAGKNASRRLQRRLQRTQLFGEVHRIMQRIVAREGRNPLTKDDIYDLRRAVEVEKRLF